MEFLEKMKTIRSTIRMHISPEKESDALNILCSLCEQIKYQIGCSSCRVYRSVDEPRAIMMEELWISEEDLRRHLRSDAYRLILLVIEMADRPPEIRFDSITDSTGFEIIEEERRPRCHRPGEML